MPDQPAAPDCATPWTTWVRSIVNGAVGDYLQARQNGLEIDMALYARNRPLPLTRAALLEAHPRPTARLCVFIHGLGCNEGSWAYRDPSAPGRWTSYGAELAADLGFTPLFVRYNTGLALARNGQSLADLLNALLAAYPLPVSDLILIGHSMGGLVIRHACHIGAQRHDPWVGLVRQAFYLGSPHDGAPLALLSDVATRVLHTVPNPITRLIGDVFDLRSQGIKDLRSPPFIEDPGHHAAPRQTVPWLTSAQHYLVVATLTEDPKHLVAILLGDGLVLVPSIPETPPDGTAPYPMTRDHVACFSRMDHLQLTRDPAVYARIRAWCAGYERSV